MDIFYSTWQFALSKENQTKAGLPFGGMFAKEKVDANELISEVIHLEDMQKTFERYLDPKERNFVKIIVEI